MNAIRQLLALGHVAGATTSHERLPSLCLALALAAVFCPVVIILGLKNGAVENLRQALLRDPSNLELRPRSSMEVDASSLSRIRALRGVGFAVPKTRSLGLAAVQFQLGEKVAELDLVPTAAGDPVLERHGAVQPGPMQAVLTFVAARALGLDANGPARIVMSVGRYDADGRREEKTLPIEVVRVLPLAATTLRAAYVNLDLLEAVEQFRENLAVPWLQWPGGDSVAADPVFDGFVVWGEEVMAPALASRVAVASNFLEQRTIEQTDPDWELAALAARHGHVKLFYNRNDPQPNDGIQRVKALLAEGNAAGVLPWSNPRELTVVDSLNRRFPVLLHTALSEDSAGTSQGMAPLAMTLPASVVISPPTCIEVASRVGRLEFPMEISGRVGSPVNEGRNILHGPPWLTGVLRHLDFRTLQWEPEGKRFLLGRRSFSGLRLYARSIEDVRPLTETLRNEGIECDSAADRVERVLELERNLGSLFLIVCAFSLTGGGAALALSLYGTIERRRRDYGMLRTLGASKLLLGFLPMIEAVVLSGAGFIIAMGLFHACAALINRVLVPQAEEAGAFCQLPLHMQASVGAVILGLALLCSSVAALRVLSISPSDAIRHA
jgi:putative ABC transport system permease protein